MKPVGWLIGSSRRSSILLAIAKTRTEDSSMFIGNIHIRMSASGYILYLHIRVF